MTATSELIFLGAHNCAPKLRLLHTRGTHHQTVLSYRPVHLDAAHARVQLAGGHFLEELAGSIAIERCIRQSTTTGALYLGFLNFKAAFWGDPSEVDASTSFQLYLYLPEEMFDRAIDFVKLGNLPELLVSIANDRGLSAREGDSGQIWAWDNVGYPSLKLETVKLSFPLNASVPVQFAVDHEHHGPF